MLESLPQVPDFLQIRDLPTTTLRGLIDASLRHRDRLAECHAGGNSCASLPKPLAGKIIANCFLEDSTRTRCSFEVAARRLGADVLNLSGVGSSTAKGETLADTARTLAAMGVDALVIRTSASGGARLAADAIEVPVINAGDGRHEHPTQAILDMAVLTRHLGALEGRTVVIVGDIANSRVARSDTHALNALGAMVRLVGPPTLVPSAYPLIAAVPSRITVHHDLDEALTGADAVIMLRLQLERAAGGATASDYRTQYQLSEPRLSRLCKNTLILHPGPMNRGTEITHTAADAAENSVILEQVEMGVAARMAVLEWAIRHQGGGYSQSSLGTPQSLERPPTPIR